MRAYLYFNTNRPLSDSDKKVRYESDRLPPPPLAASSPTSDTPSSPRDQPLRLLSPFVNYLCNAIFPVDVAANTAFSSRSPAHPRSNPCAASGWQPRPFPTHREE